MKIISLRLWLAVILLAALPLLAQETPSVPSALADQHLVKKETPEYPPLALVARISGAVVLELTISKEGKVTAVKNITGHPLLLPPASQAAKRRRYSPFLVGGQPTEVRTRVTVEFTLGGPGPNETRDEKITRSYVQQEAECRELLQKRRYPEAETSCSWLSELAAELPGNRELPQFASFEYLGHAAFGEQKFTEALGFYKQELAIAEASFPPTDVNLAYAYNDVARGLRGAGDLPQARAYYERAIHTVELADAPSLPAPQKRKNALFEKSVVREYAGVLRKSGDVAAADAADKKSAAIAVPEQKDN